MGYINYDRLIQLLADRGLTSRKVRLGNIIGQKTWRAIHTGRSGAGQHIDTRTIAALCKALECQPGDILDYVDDDGGDSNA